MRAAIISERNAPPVVGEFCEPQSQDGAVLIDVDTAGLGGWDVLGAYLGGAASRVEREGCCHGISRRRQAEHRR